MRSNSLILSTTLFLATVLAVPASGAVPSVEDLFRTTFDSSLYVEDECRENFARFLRLADEKGVDLSDAEILMIQNYGTALHQGVVGKAVRSSSSAGGIGVSRWDYHVVLLENGIVYDFAFKNDPTPTPESDYWLEMFLTEKERPSLYTRLSEIGNFMITAYTAESYVRHLKGSARGLDQTTEIRLKDRLPELFPKF